MISSHRANTGFTLIEILVTVAIVGVMASVVLPMMELTVQRSKEQELRSALREIRGALDAYLVAGQEGRIAHSVTMSGYPPSLKTLVDGVTDARSPSGKSMIYFLRRIPRDPFYTDDESTAADEQWGIRSYGSSADEPDEGEDVYDVYTRSSGVGLNGIAYKDW
ncbi:MAG: type II secretion system protein [Gallionella sp.]